MSGGRAVATPSGIVPPFISPPATLGVLGGGQLGRMFAQAAQRMGYGVAVLDADEASPAGGVAQAQIKADYLDAAGLAALAERCAAVTTEFENVPAEALRRLAERVVVAPSADSVAVCQDRLAEKAHFARCGVPCALHASIESAAQLAAADARLLPGILKTARLGYDGKGQLPVDDAAGLAVAWQAMGSMPCVLEQRLALAYEVSVIVARNAAGDCVHLPLQQNLHRDGILAVTQVPAPDAAPAVQRQAFDAARRIAAGLGYVGVLCVEFFVLHDGTLVANEMAPRPHNSGHHSLDACDVSQFELQVRTLTGAPLVPPRLHSAAVMLNLLGELWFCDASADVPSSAAVEPDWAPLLALPGVHLHLYGKHSAQPGRKMGHLTVTAASAAEARAVALEAARRLGIAPF